MAKGSSAAPLLYSLPPEIFFLIYQAIAPAKDAGLVTCALESLRSTSRTMQKTVALLEAENRKILTIAIGHRRFDWVKCVLRLPKLVELRVAVRDGTILADGLRRLTSSNVDWKLSKLVLTCHLDFNFDDSIPVRIPGLQSLCIRFIDFDSMNPSKGKFIKIDTTGFKAIIGEQADTLTCLRLEHCDFQYRKAMAELLPRLEHLQELRVNFLPAKILFKGQSLEKLEKLKIVSNVYIDSDVCNNHNNDWSRTTLERLRDVTIKFEENLRVGPSIRNMFAVLHPEASVSIHMIGCDSLDPLFDTIITTCKSRIRELEIFGDFNMPDHLLLPHLESLQILSLDSPVVGCSFPALRKLYMGKCNPATLCTMIKGNVFPKACDISVSSVHGVCEDVADADLPLLKNVIGSELAREVFIKKDKTSSEALDAHAISRFNKAGIPLTLESISLSSLTKLRDGWQEYQGQSHLTMYLWGTKDVQDFMKLPFDAWRCVRRIGCVYVDFGKVCEVLDHLRLADCTGIEVTAHLCHNMLFDLPRWTNVCRGSGWDPDKVLTF
jgi:hypothetical protein